MSYSAFRNLGPWLIGFICCVWPVIGWAVITYLPHLIRRVIERMPDDNE